MRFFHWKILKIPYDCVHLQQNLNKIHSLSSIRIISSAHLKENILKKRSLIVLASREKWNFFFLLLLYWTQLKQQHFEFNSPLNAITKARFKSNLKNDFLLPQLKIPFPFLFNSHPFLSLSFPSHLKTFKISFKHHCRYNV